MARKTSMLKAMKKTSKRLSKLSRKSSAVLAENHHELIVSNFVIFDKISSNFIFTAYDDYGGGDKYKESFLIDSGLIGRLVGAKGATIQEYQSEYGVRINIDKNDDDVNTFPQFQL